MRTGNRPSRPKRKPPAGWPTGGFAYFELRQLLEMNVVRMGLRTVSAMTAATMFRMAAT